MQNAKCKIGKGSAFRILHFAFLILHSFLIAALPTYTASAQKQKGFKLTEDKQKKQLNVLYNGQLLTAYCYFDSVMKPVLFPVNTIDGITVTRGYPLQPRNGERTDHPHHIGIWMNYESVNGLDFWNNSTSIPSQNRNKYGTIRHISVRKGEQKQNTTSISAQAGWYRPDGKKLIDEDSKYVFTVRGKRFIIDRMSTLTATEEDVVFKDVKDGFFAIRVARELEHPSQQKDIFFDAQGNKTDVPRLNNEGVTGMYLSGNGKKGDSVWSTQAEWVQLTGVMAGKKITIAIFDHPANPGFPAYWHARGYGLFAVNPLGRNIFSNGKETLNLTIRPGNSVTFRYRVVIESGNTITPQEIDQLSKEFNKK